MFSKRGMMIAAVFLVGVGALMLWKYLKGSAEVAIVAAEQDVTVTVDGKAVNPPFVPAGDFARYHLAQGKHTIALTSGGKTLTREVNLESGFSRFVVPSDEGQCFVVLDVTDASYGRGKAEKPRIVERHTDHQPFAFSSSSYFSDGSMPRRIKGSQKVLRVVDLPCDKAGAPDPELIGLLWR
jgi:hypothetical protein